MRGAWRGGSAQGRCSENARRGVNAPLAPAACALASSPLSLPRVQLALTHLPVSVTERDTTHPPHHPTLQKELREIERDKASGVTVSLKGASLQRLTGYLEGE